MPSGVLAILVAVLACAGAAAADNAFLLGLDYSKPAGYGLTDSYGYGGVIATATDASGSLYLLAAGDPTVPLPSTAFLGPVMQSFYYGSPHYYVEKLTPQGDQVYLTIFGFAAFAIAVDASGNAYVTGGHSVAKLNAAGTAFVYNVDLGPGVYPGPIAVDPMGRVYVAGLAEASALTTTPTAFQGSPRQGGPFVVRLNLDGSVGYATYFGGPQTYVVGTIGAFNDQITAIAVDATGSAILLGWTDGLGFATTPGAYLSTFGPGAGPFFLAKLNPDGSALVYSTFTGPNSEKVTGLAVDANGNTVVSFVTGVLPFRAGVKAFNADGTALRWTNSLPEGFSFPTSALNAMAVDEAGDTYVVGTTRNANLAVKNSLASCGSAFLAVYGPGGELLQSTFLPGLDANLSALDDSAVGVTLAPDGVVYVVGNPEQHQVPSERGALLRLSQHPNGTPVQLACVGNAASYDPGPVATGELVSLFGQGLGPAEGVQPRVDLKTGFPSQLANVQVTFDGRPAPLLYVQDNQINAIVPWSLSVGSTTEICVVYHGAKTNCLERSVTDTAPGVFTTDGIHAATLNQDGSLNSSTNPAQPGSMVSIFATGLGPISPAQADGSIVRMPLPVNTVQWSVAHYISGSIPLFPSLAYMDVQYAGPAPFAVAGVSQINFRLNANSFGDLQLAHGYGFTGLSRGFYIWIAGQ